MAANVMATQTNETTRRVFGVAIAAKIALPVPEGKWFLAVGRGNSRLNRSGGEEYKWRLGNRRHEQDSIIIRGAGSADGGDGQGFGGGISDSERHFRPGQRC